MADVEGPVKKPEAPAPAVVKQTPAPAATSATAESAIGASVALDGNASVARELGLEAEAAPAPMDFADLQMDAVAASTASASLEGRVAGVRGASGGSQTLGSTKDGYKQTATSARATAGALGEALAGTDSGTRTAVIAQSADAITAATDGILKTKDATQIKSVFADLASAAEKAGPENIGAMADAMIANLSTGDTDVMSAFQTGIDAAMKAGNTLLAAGLMKRLAGDLPGATPPQ